MALLNVVRGAQVKISSRPVSDGALLFATDTKKIYLDDGAERVEMTSLPDLSDYITSTQLSSAIEAEESERQKQDNLLQDDIDKKLQSDDLVQGSNVTLNTTSQPGKIVISATDTKYGAATTETSGLMSAADKEKLDGIATGANKYTLPTASSSTLGGVKTGANITNSSGTISLTKANVTAALGYTPPTADTNTWIAFKGATTSAAGTAGYAPAPAAGAANRYLRSDGTWSVPPDTNTTYSNMKGATSSVAGSAGLVPAPAAGKQTSFLRGDGTWVVPTNTNTTYTLTKSGSTITLNGSDGSETSVTDSNTTYSLSSFGVTATAAEINKLDGLATTKTELGYLDGVTSNVQTQLNGKAASGHSHSTATTSAAGFLRQLNGSTSNFLRGDGTWATPPNTTYSAMKGATSSAAGSTGLVPAPAAGAATRYLRSDGTWQVPPDTNTTYTLSSFGITATAAELNKLDGCTATVTELNYVDGVTSNIQTQLNGKAASSHTHNYAGSSSAGGNANAAVKLATARNIGLSGDASGSVSFNGTANVNIPATVLHHGQTAIGTNANLNSYTDPGWYYCTSNATAATVSNSPTDNAFTLIVSAHAGTNQIVIEYMTSAFHIWTRNYYNNAWGSWAEIYTTIQKPTASEIGAAASSHNHSAANITSGTLAVGRGGTGITANPSMLVNLGSTSAASVFATSPRPGVTGTLAIARGGTGATSAASARSNIGAAPSDIVAVQSSQPSSSTCKLWIQI